MCGQDCNRFNGDLMLHENEGIPYKITSDHTTCKLRGFISPVKVIQTIKNHELNDLKQSTNSKTKRKRFSEKSL